MTICGLIQLGIDKPDTWDEATLSGTWLGSDGRSRGAGYYYFGDTLLLGGMSTNGIESNSDCL
jgi:hypothetical protein